MSDNVISLFGNADEAPTETTMRTTKGPETPAGAPVESVVRELEQLLEAARKGEIIGFAGAYQYPSRIVGYSFAGAVQGYAMLGGLECVRMRLAQRAIDAGKV